MSSHNKQFIYFHELAIVRIQHTRGGQIADVDMPTGMSRKKAALDAVGNLRDTARRVRQHQAEMLIEKRHTHPHEQHSVSATPRNERERGCEGGRVRERQIKENIQGKRI
jgi:hypothetical protein